MRWNFLVLFCDNKAAQRNKRNKRNTFLSKDTVYFFRKRHYANMTTTFIFKEAPAFDDLMKRIAELQERFRNMK